MYLFIYLFIQRRGRRAWTCKKERDKTNVNKVGEDVRSDELP
jgi:hypothetical protein